MINTGNRAEYFLYFVTNSPQGLSKMKQARWTFVRAALARPPERPSGQPPGWMFCSSSRTITC